MKKTQFKFIKHTKIWFLISAIAILIGIGAMVNNKVQNGQFISLGIDFTGGTLMELKFEEAGENQSQLLSDVINSAVPDTVSQITVTDQDTYIVHGKDLEEAEYDSIRATIEEEMGAFEEIRYTTIGPKIGATLKKKAMIALSIALVAIVF
jgi:preprotein translocase subunit SecF